MSSADSGQKTEGIEAKDTAADPKTPPLLAPSEDEGKGSGTKEGHGPTGFKDEVEALKRRLFELEQQANVNPADPERAARQQRMAELEEYRRMESCLYRHRKEWDATTGPGKWGLYDEGPREYMDPEPRFRHIPSKRNWFVNWRFKSNKYPQPDPFDPMHNCGSDWEDGKPDAPPDDYDQAIDYGDRRDRLRKNFEWELDRLYLEEEMTRRKKQRAEEAEERPPKKGEVHPEEEASEALARFAEPKAQRLDWFSFRRLVGIEEKDACVLDILKGNPVIDDSFGYRIWYGFSGRRERKLDASQDPKALASMAPGQPALPERIRIHSTALIGILSKILGRQVAVDDHGITVIIRPFKSLVYGERGLRDWCTALEKKFSASSNTTGKPDPTDHDGAIASTQTGDGPVAQEPKNKSSLHPADGGSFIRNEVTEDLGGSHEDQTTLAEEGEGGEKQDDADDFTKSTTALEHLKCLLDFVDTDIVPKQLYLKSPECRKIFFCDLWQLFRPGMEVIGGDGKQAYRVVGVTSEKHRVAPPWEKWSSDAASGKRKSKPAFSITCVYIDFDGKRLGPVPKVFEFKTFDREREITSLEVYPLQFHPVKRLDFSDSEWEQVQAFPAHQKYRQKLIHRGSMFLQVAAVKHMYYAGPTLEAREEVESQVVVDFETAFAVEDESQKLWKPELATMIGNINTRKDGEEEVEVEVEERDCNAGCCRGETVYDDSYVDQQQSTEYVNSLLPDADTLNEQPSIAVVPRLLKELQNAPGSTLVSKEELAIMSYRVFGFVLRSRKWGKSEVHLVPVRSRWRFKKGIDKAPF